MTEKTICLEAGPQIIFRKPTEKEVLSYLDKTSQIETGIRPSADAFDDGDYELLACVTSPGRPEIESLLEDYPLLNRQLSNAFLELAGAGKSYKQDDSVITEEHKKAGKRLIGVVVNGQPIVMTKISRMEMKSIEIEVKEQKLKTPLPSVMAKLARSHVVITQSDGEKVKQLLLDVPLLAANLGFTLFSGAVAKVKEEEGKS